MSKFELLLGHKLLRPQQWNYNRVSMGLTVNRQPSNGLKINRQPSKTEYFYRQPSNERAKISRQTSQLSLNDRDRLT